MQASLEGPGKRAEAIYGSSEEGYCLLPSYCEQIKKTNRGSHADVFTVGSDSQFQRFFIFYYASLHGFLNGCLPVICLCGIQLKSKYLGTLLSATSFDADGGVSPLAFSVVDEENDDSWMWFLLELRKALDTSTEKIPPLTFLFDGQKNAVTRKFPSSCHAICMQYLSETISKEFKNSRLVQLLWKAAYSTSTMGFKEKMTEIEEVSSDAATWLQQYPPSRWALIHFDGTRYGHFSSNINEFNKWILEALELPIFQVIKYNTWSSTLTPSAEKRIEEARIHASVYQVLMSDEVEFEVFSTERSDIVNAVRPPKFRRPPGPPEKKRLCVEDLNREKHTVHCSKCNQTGHYMTTCKTEIAQSTQQV
ncbi:unnamed protein product [Withania somnifera]